MSDVEDAIRTSVSVLGGFLIGEKTLVDTLARLADLTCRAVPRADMAGIALPVAGAIRVAVCSDDLVADMDSVQYDSGVGPSLDALRDQRPYRIGSTADDLRWPVFASAAAALGIVSTLSLPLVAHHEGIGALTLFSRGGTFSDDDQELGWVFATQAALVAAHSYARDLGYHLGEAMRSRAVIEQAKGVLMARAGVAPEEGFRMLVRASNQQNLKVRDIATEIVREAEQGFTPGDVVPTG